MIKNVMVKMATCLLVVATSMTASADDWPQWRGVNGRGAVAENKAPKQLDADKNLLWKTDLPGPGASTPMVWDGRIVVTCEIDGHDGVVCYDQAGREKWRHVFGPTITSRHRSASGCNPSPVTEGQLVYVYYKSGTLAALTLSGELRWQINVQKLYGKSTLLWDLGTSPVMTTKGLVIAVMQNDDSYVLCLDKKTGKKIWRGARKVISYEESYDAYTTPSIARVDGVETIVTWGGDHVVGHCAETGKQLWQAGGYNPEKAVHWRVIASAVVIDGIAVAPFGRGHYLVGVKLGGSGDVTESNTVWVKDGVGADVPTPAARDGRVYVLGDRGHVTCLEATSGDVHWAERLPSGASKFYASPLLAGDRLYCIASKGLVYCGRVTDKGLTNVVETRIQDSILASPIVVDDQILIRGRKALYCFGVAGAEK